MNQVTILPLLNIPTTQRKTRRKRLRSTPHTNGAVSCSSSSSSSFLLFHHHHHRHNHTWRWLLLLLAWIIVVVSSSVSLPCVAAFSLVPRFCHTASFELLQYKDKTKTKKRQPFLRAFPDDGGGKCCVLFSTFD